MLRDRESGQSIIIIAAVVVVLLALVALVVDVGNAYAHRRIVQNAVDAAALAGARRLADSFIDKGVLEIQVLEAVHDYAELNGLNPAAVDAWFIDADDDEREQLIGSRPFPVPPWAEGVKVAGDLPFPTYLAQLLGFSEMTASTTAKAWVLHGPCSAPELFPLTVSTSVFSDTAGVPDTNGKIYTLWDHGDRHTPGNWGWLYWEDMDGDCRCFYPDVCCPQNAAASNLLANIEDNTRSGMWRANEDWVSGGSGVMIGGVLDKLLPLATEDRHVIIPLYSNLVGTGNNTKYEIAGFAAFELVCVFSSKGHYAERFENACEPCMAGGSSSDKCIRGWFVEEVIPSTDDGCLDTSLFIPSFRQPKR